MVSVKSNLPFYCLPLGLLAGIFSGFHFSPSPGNMMITAMPGLLIALVYLVFERRPWMGFVLLVGASFMVGNLITTASLEQSLNETPSVEELNRSYKIKARVLRQWKTEYGAALSIDKIRILSPQSASWRLNRLTVYMPATEKKVARHTEITGWVRLRRRLPSQPIPFPMQELREKFMPKIVGSTKSLELLEMEWAEDQGISPLNKGNRQLVDVFFKGAPSNLWRERLDAFGLGHLLAISGLHCILLYFAIQFLIWPLRRPILRFLITALGLLAFAHWVGWSASVSRASLMMILWHLLPQAGRPRSWLRLWMALMLMALISNPLYLLMRGFWYSFAASLGLILGSRYAESSPLDHPLLKKMRPFLPIVSAQLFVAPINLMFTAHANFISLFWNFLGFMVLIILLVLLALCLLAMIIPASAWIPNGLEQLIGSLTSSFQPDPGFLELIRFPFQPYQVALTLLLMVLFLRFGGRERRWYLSGLVLVCLSFFNKPLSGERLVMLDVGQGLCILYVGPDGEGVMFDAGGQLPPGMSFYLATRLMGVSQLKTASISHLNWDHYSFLEDLDPKITLQAPVGRLQDFKDNALLSSFSITPAQKGNTFELNELKGEILWPQPGLAYPNDNEESLVISLKGKTWTLLITGDAGTWMERHLKDFKPEGIGILQVGHHGSKSATSRGFLKMWKPDYALISCGRENRFGHPHPTVLKNLNQVESTIMDTSQLGSILIMDRGELVMEPLNSVLSR